MTTLKEHIIGRGIVPFVGLIIAYYMAMTIIYHYFLSAPNPALGTLSKYIISLAFDALDITRFTFSLPTEYAQSIADAGLNASVAIASPHCLRMVLHTHIYIISLLSRCGGDNISHILHQVLGAIPD